jgi:hypothetical protein
MSYRANTLNNKAGPKRAQSTVSRGNLKHATPKTTKADNECVKTLNDNDTFTLARSKTNESDPGFEDTLDNMKELSVMESDINIAKFGFANPLDNEGNPDKAQSAMSIKSPS